MALTSGERLTLIKRCGQALADQNWTDIDLTLRTFGFPWSDEWPGADEYQYLIHHLTEGEDSALVDLHAYLYPDATTEPTSTEIGIWQTGHFRVFLSHVHEHREVAAEVRNALRRWWVDTFVAHDMIEPTREWEDEIETALGTCDALVALLTPEFVTSKWCDQEVGYCLARGVPVVPIIFGAMPHGFIAKFQALNCSRLSGFQIARAVFRTLATHEMAHEKMHWQIVQRYVNSPSFAGTREAFELLKTIPAEKWTDPMVDAVENEGPNNRQVAEAFPLNDKRLMPQAVSEHLDAILERTASDNDDLPF